MQDWLALHVTRRAISYARFSHPSQIETDSLRRQAERTRQVVEKFGLHLDVGVRFADLGLSGYTGENRRKGALADIIEAVKAEAVPRFTKLIVESLDRISRQDPYVAMGAIRELCDLDVIIVTADMQVYSRDRLAKDPAAGFILQGVLLRAHEESRTKSERVRAAREANREALRNGTRIKLPKMLPGWLRSVGGEAVEISERVETLRLIFQLAADNVASATIAQQLNREERATFHRAGQGIQDRRARAGWNAEAVLRIIRNPAARGYYQPHTKDAMSGKRLPAGEPIRCYPQTISDPEWQMANANVTRRYEACKPDRVPNRAKIANLLAGNTFCSRCGGRASRYSSDARKNHKDGYLICDAAHRSYRKNGERVCRGVGRHYYGQIEGVILSEVAPNIALRASRGTRFHQEGRVAKAQQDAAEAKDDADKAGRRVQRLLNLDSDDPMFADAVAQRNAAMMRLREAENALIRQSSTEASDNAMWRAMKELVAGAASRDEGCRLRLRDILREHVQAILHADRCEIRIGSMTTVIDRQTGTWDTLFEGRSLRKTQVL